MSQQGQPRQLPIGAEALPEGGVHFRVWAPRCRRVEVVIEGGPGYSSDNPQGTELTPETLGYFSGRAATAAVSTRYRFRLDNSDALYPDPASRFQPDGPHGPSQVIDARRFRWTDGAWRGVKLEGQVLYEMHIGTFTPEGTWASAMRELPELAATGITVVEVMPVAEFPGHFGWGYDGVDFFAPTHLYGEPDDFRRFVDRAHALGMGVILDVVYNHVGPDGNYLKQFAEAYFTDRYTTAWGEAINFDGENAGRVREFFIVNAGYWIAEFHLDGLRLDATQTIYDQSSEHILAAITRRVREMAGGRSTIIVAENEAQHVQLVRPPEQGGYGIDALWNDDFHHSAMVALTGHNEAYYADHLGKPQEFISAIKWGYLYQGQRSAWHKQRRGTPGFGLKPATFVTFLQNHDQVANAAHGQRCHVLTSPGRYKALTALLLLGPGTPMLWQGQEFAASSPFFFFADHRQELAKPVYQGRVKYLSQFHSMTTPEMQSSLPDPADPATFARSKLDVSEREQHADMYRLHRDLLQLRREDPVFRAQRRGGIDGAVLGLEAFVLRFFGEHGQDRLLLVNLGLDLTLHAAPEPLLAPPEGMQWETRWSSEDPRYGGGGTLPLETEEYWRIPGHAAVVLATQGRAEEEHEQQEQTQKPK
jgi:maltooligosyltrehalose trehalohydrolase